MRTNLQKMEPCFLSAVQSYFYFFRRAKSSTDTNKTLNPASEKPPPAMEAYFAAKHGPFVEPRAGQRLFFPGLIKSKGGEKVEFEAAADAEVCSRKLLLCERLQIHHEAVKNCITWNEMQLPLFHSVCVCVVCVCEGGGG